MQNKSSSDIFIPHEVESLLPEDVVVLADSAGVALGLSRLPGTRGRNVGDRGASIITTRYVEIPLVGSDGEVSGILFRSAPCSGTRGVPFARGAEAERSTGGVAQFVVHDINNLFAVIGGGLRLLERQSDVAYREAIVGTMQEAIARGMSLSRQLLDTARPCRNPIDGLVAGDRLAAITGTLHWALRPDITICIEIAPDLWTFNADPEGLYFALLNLCRNADDAMPAGGTITVSARNVELSADADRRFVEIVVADEGESCPRKSCRRRSFRTSQRRWPEAAAASDSLRFDVSLKNREGRSVSRASGVLARWFVSFSRVATTRRSAAALLRLQPRARLHSNLPAISDYTQCDKEAVYTQKRERAHKGFPSGEPGRFRECGARL
ncbi:hypothetical protein [Bradyrhizobium liaoningense]|uniref:hypothetical protein n=1 Tax=Bradyrhizobium liaoningense TaxID=43992 RepID=UPI003D9B2F21